MERSRATRDAALPVVSRLYWANARAEDDDRRAKVGVPEEITFKTKPQIALEQIRWACEVGLPGSMVLVDAGYGHDSKLRWRIERDYQELKQEVGLGHYEGRGWRGFHHHATMCIA